jgi:hypothetical protein
MNRLPLAFVILSFAIQCGAEQPKRVVTYQTLPGSTTRDWRAPTKVTEGSFTYQTLPGSTTRDWRAPSWVTKDGLTYQTMPGSTERDWRAPSFRTEKR